MQFFKGFKMMGTCTFLFIKDITFIQIFFITKVHTFSMVLLQILVNFRLKFRTWEKSKFNF